METDKMLAKEEMEWKEPEWPSPVVFASKKNGPLRFWVDYRKLNAVTVRISYHFPRMDG